MPDGEGGGLTGEVHLIKHDNKKYVVRKCDKLAKAIYYEHLSRIFEKNRFLPKFLGRHGKNVFYEFIEGRDLKQDEKIKIFREIGIIMAKVNGVKINKKINSEFHKLLRELETGNYGPNLKVRIARKRRKIRKTPKKQLSASETNKIRKLYKRLNKILKPKLTYEITDPTYGNFRLSKNKLYLVDIESIKIRIKGYGISKFLSGWGKLPKRKKEFLNGYNKFHSTNFLTEEYQKFIDLNFLITSLNFQAQTGKDTKQTKDKLISLI